MYEDVESVKKLIMEQNSRKRKAGLRSKNVYVALSVIVKPVCCFDLVSFPFLTDPYAESHSTVSLF